MVYLGVDSNTFNILFRKRVPFYNYCAKHWIQYAAVRKEKDGKLHELIIVLFIMIKKS